MNKRLGLFIVLAVILIVIAGTIGIKEVIEPTSGGVAQRKVEEFGIEQEGQIYVIGEHLFTERNIKGYLSENMILEAAKTADGITEGMTKEEILSKIIVYARDAEGNWINALTGENITTLGSDFKFNIKYINLEKIPEKVSSEEEFMTAFEDKTVNTITLTDNINITRVLEIAENREITLELNGKTIDVSNIGEANKYGIVVDGGSLILNGPGKIITDDKTKTNVSNLSGTLEVNEVEMLGGYNIKTNWKNTGGQTTTTINNSELTALDHSCVASWEDSEVYINDSTLIGFYAAVSTNGTARNVNMNIKGSTLSATCKEENSVVYMPSTGILKIEDTSLEGHTGISACAGTINVINSEINATGDYWDTTRVEANGSSMWCDGSAVLLRSQGSYGKNSKMILNLDDKTTASSTNGPAIRVHEYTKNKSDSHGVSAIEVNYYSNRLSSGGEFDKILKEPLATPLTTITVNDLSETVTE